MQGHVYQWRKAVRAALLLLLALPAVAEPPDIIAPMQCKNGLCLMPAEFARQLIEAHNELVDENRELREQKTPKCAKTEVTEPSKAPKLDKKLIELKPERNS